MNFSWRRSEDIAMRVAMYYRNDDIRIEEIEKPSIDRKELLVKVMASGICGSDVMEWYRIKSAPRVLGHEIAGLIEETGKAVRNFHAGDRVFVSHHVPCNTCRYCLRGQHTVCDLLHSTNFDPGGFSEYLRVPEVNIDRGVFRLPDEMTYEEGSFIEPLGCVIRGQRVAGIKPGQSVLVLGSGISGLLHIALARATGVGRILATDIHAYRLKAAERFGADIAMQAGNCNADAVKQANGGYLADVVIVCTGSFAAFPQALATVDRGGTVLCFAPTEPGVDLPVTVNPFWRNETTLLTSYGAAPQDITTAIQIIASNRLPLVDMITHRLGLSEIAEGFRLVEKADASIKVLIDPQR